MRGNNGIQITSAKGTIYFIRDGEGLKQGYDLEFDNPGSAVDVTLTVKWGSNKQQLEVGRVGRGCSTARVYIPDIRENVGITFSVDGGGSLSINHKPQRHWTVHLIQFAHHDLGYTDIPTNVLRDMATYLDDALRFCAETDSFPDKSKFRYTIEQGWSLLYWMQNRPPEAREEMMRRIKEGRIEVNAFVGNETTELLGPEEMVRMMYPVFALKRQYGIPVLSAEHNDIPGISWGVAAAMAGAGIKWFAPGLPDYFRWGSQYHTFWDEETIAPGGRPHAFYWEAPDGKKTLFWYHRQGAGGPVDVTLGELPGYLEKLETRDYPYDVLRYIVRGGDRDNSNTRVEYAYTCREWNEKWAYPRLVQSLNSRFFPELEKQLAEDIPTWRGELPGTDYSVAASCTAYPSSLNRVAHDRLLAGERFAAVTSEIASYKYPRQTLDEAYYCTLMNDEHAWGLAYPLGPGQDACLAQHCEFGYRAAALAHDVLIKSINELADHINRDEDGFYAVVFNALDRPRTDVATVMGHPTEPCARPMKPDPQRRFDSKGSPVAYYAYPVSNRNVFVIPEKLLEEGLEVIDVATGETVPHEIYEIPNAQAPVPYAAYRYSTGQHYRRDRMEVRFVASDVPALGYKLYKLVPSRKKAPESGVKVGANVLENEFYKVEVDSNTGAVRSIFDKELGRELVDAASEHGVNQLVIRSSLDASKWSPEQVQIEQGRSGAVSGSLVIRTQCEGFPQVTQEIILYSGIKRIDFANRVLKDSSAHMETFFAFPFAFDKPKFKYEGSLSIIEPLVDQFPGSNSEYYCVQHWANVSDGKAGVTLCSVDAPMMQFGGNWTLYVSQAHHGVTPPNFDHPFHTQKEVKNGHIYSLALLNNYRTNFSPTQNGDLLFRYSLTSHAGDWKKGLARDFGYGVSVPLETANLEGKHRGQLPASAGFCQIDKPGILLLALKRAEDGRGFIVRVMETEGVETEVTITLPFISILQAIETNLVEEDLRLVPMTEHTVKLKVKAWGTATVRVVNEGSRQ